MLACFQRVPQGGVRCKRAISSSLEANQCYGKMIICPDSSTDRITPS